MFFLMQNRQTFLILSISWRRKMFIGSKGPILCNASRTYNKEYNMKYHLCLCSQLVPSNEQFYRIFIIWKTKENTLLHAAVVRFFQTGHFQTFWNSKKTVWLSSWRTSCKDPISITQDLSIYMFEKLKNLGAVRRNKATN